MSRWPHVTWFTPDTLPDCERKGAGDVLAQSQDVKKGRMLTDIGIRGGEGTKVINTSERIERANALLTASDGPNTN